MFKFRPAKGTPYKQILSEIHETLCPEWYLEIGTEKGESAQLSKAHTICIDPNLILKNDILGSKPSVHLFQMTSDDFFDEGHSDRFDGLIDFAFLDGLHLFEYLLRDFMNMEKISKPETVVALHDIVPINFPASDRVWDRRKTGSWTGDVWKIIPALREFRPDLKITVLDCSLSGLALVENLDRNNRVLNENYNVILARYRDLTLEDYGEDALYQTLAMEQTKSWAVAKHFEKKTTLQSPTIQSLHLSDLAIKIPPASTAVQENWGEFHFASSLKVQLEQRGARVRIDCEDRWYENRDRGEPELVLRGPKKYEASKINPCIYWVLFHSNNLTKAELSDVEYVAVASTKYLQSLQQANISAPLGPLLHCTDPNLFKPIPPNPEHAAELLFVGVQHPERKEGGLVRLALNSRLPVTVWGPNWEHLPDGVLRGRRLKNSELCAHYCSAKAVLNDHMLAMRKHSFMNNRLFDALACGVPVISDHCDGVPTEFKEFVYIANTSKELIEAFNKIGQETEQKRTNRKEFAEKVRENHNFNKRAAEIEKILNEITR